MLGNILTLMYNVSLLSKICFLLSKLYITAAQISKEHHKHWVLQSAVFASYCEYKRSFSYLGVCMPLSAALFVPVRLKVLGMCL